MTALTRERPGSFEIWHYKQFTLASGTKAYKGGIALLDKAIGKVIPGTTEVLASTDLLYIGTFEETVDAIAGDKLVDINLQNEMKARWFGNSGTSPAVATDVGKLCYVEDDQTVSMSGSVVAGRIWSVTSGDGVLVEKLQTVPEDGGVGVETALAAFSANNSNVPDYPASGAVFEVPTTAAASTITLPADAHDGTEITFVADGVKNAHTVQYRDETGLVNLTAALTASKRHQVRAVFLNGFWTAISGVSP